MVWIDSMTGAEKREATEKLKKNGETQDSIFNIETKGLGFSLPEIFITFVSKIKV